MTAEPRKSTVRRRARRPVAAVVFALAPVLAVLASVQGACVKTGASLGQTCLANEDCFSGLCSGQLCVSAPPILDAEIEGDGEAAEREGASDAPTSDASDGGGDGVAPADGSGDASPEANDATSGEAGPDATSDAAGTIEGGLDAPTDVQLDVDGG